MEHKKSILIVYDYFYPGYRAGGPIQSLTNLIVVLQNYFDFSIFTSAFDLDQNEPYEDIEMDKWNKILLPRMHKPINVYYASKTTGTKKINNIFYDLRNNEGEISPSNHFLYDCLKIRMSIKNILGLLI